MRQHVDLDYGFHIGRQRRRLRRLFCQISFGEALDRNQNLGAAFAQNRSNDLGLQQRVDRIGLACGHGTGHGNHRLV